jgi:hypothetical protein
MRWSTITIINKRNSFHLKRIPQKNNSKTMKSVANLNKSRKLDKGNYKNKEIKSFSRRTLSRLLIPYFPSRNAVFIARILAALLVNGSV